MSGRVEVWERATKELFLPLEIEAKSGVITGEIAGLSRESIRLLKLSASPHYGVRTPDLAQGEGAGYLAVAFAGRQGLEVNQYRSRTRLTSGECAIYDTSGPFEVGNKHPFRAQIALLPKEQLDISSEELTRIAASTLDRQTSLDLAMVISRIASSENLDVEPLFEQIASVLKRAMKRMVGTTSSVAMPVRADDSERHQQIESKFRRSDEELVRAVTEIVSLQLADVRLGPDYLAAVLGVSRRRLYAACSDALGPIATYVRQSRLGHAAHILRDRDCDSLPIGEVARLSGFEDLAHFDRLFRQVYGMTPSKLRES